MTIHALTIPQWGLAMEEATIVEWSVAEGAQIKPGLEIANLETSKVVNVLEARVTGVLRRIVSGVGATRPVGAIIGVVTDGDELDNALDQYIAEFEARFATVQTSGAKSREPETIDVAAWRIRYFKMPAANVYKVTAPVVLVHGFGGDFRNWMFNQTELASDRDSYALDLPGHGGSSKNVGSGSFEELAASLLAWADAIKLPAFHVVGHSMGAGVAIVATIMAPDRFKSITLVNGVGLGARINRSYIEGFISAPRRKDLKPIVDLLFANPDLATKEMLDDLIAFKRLDGVTGALRALADQALSDSRLEKLDSELAQVAVPALAIVGGSDRITPPREIGAAIVETTRLTDVGHMAHLEAASKVNGLLGSFLRRND